MLPKELRGGRVAVGLSPLQCGEAVLVGQLGVGPGSQQDLYARLLPMPLVSGHLIRAVPVALPLAPTGQGWPTTSQGRQRSALCIPRRTTLKFKIYLLDSRSQLSLAAHLMTDH